MKCRPCCGSVFTWLWQRMLLMTISQSIGVEKYHFKSSLPKSEPNKKVWVFFVKIVTCLTRAQGTQVWNPVASDSRWFHKLFSISQTFHRVQTINTDKSRKQKCWNLNILLDLRKLHHMFLNLWWETSFIKRLSHYLTFWWKMNSIKFLRKNVIFSNIFITFIHCCFLCSLFVVFLVHYRVIHRLYG